MKKLLLLTFLFTSFLCEAQSYLPVTVWKTTLPSKDQALKVLKLNNNNFGVFYNGIGPSAYYAELNNDGRNIKSFSVEGSTTGYGIQFRGSFQLNDSVILFSDQGFVKYYNIIRGTENSFNPYHADGEIFYMKKRHPNSFSYLQRDVWGSSTDLIFHANFWQSVRQTPFSLDGNRTTVGYDYLSTADMAIISNSDSNNDIRVDIVDTLGNYRNRFTYGGSGSEFPISVKVLDNDKILIYGITTSSDGNITNRVGGSSDLWLLLIDTTGNVIFSKCLGGIFTERTFPTIGSFEPDLLAVSNDGNIIVLGQSEIDNNLQSRNTYLAKVNVNNGNIIWQHTLTDIRNVVSMQVLQNDTIVLLGQKPKGDFFDSAVVQKIFIKKIDQPDSITGKIFQGQNTNCTQEVNEKGIPNVILKAEPKNFYGISDSSGKYSILTDTGKYGVKQIIPKYALPLFKNVVCPANGMYQNISFTEYGKDTTEINFANDITLCAYLQVELSQGRMRRCFDNNTTIKYCNNGNIDTTNVQVIVTLPEYVTFVSANNTNYTISGKKITFNIGNLRANECGTINLITKVDCVNGITGLTQCISAYILPRNKCVDQIQPDYALWDKSEVSVDGRCTGNTARFVIKNIGQNNMTDSSSYRIYKDAVQAVNKKFKLTAGDSLVINVTALGFTYRLEADQVLHFPSASLPSVTIENCGTGVASRGFVNQMPQNTVAPDVEKICLPIRDSYDPNDKSVSPSGVGTNKLVKHKVPLDYLIRFQNTGTDTAYKVVIIDTLDQNLDLSTLEFGASSHPYKIEFTGSGKPILKFTFNQINLVDSFTNEPKSHGFVSFKITPYDSIPNGTLVKNSADIYFDFNLPIKTNTTQVSIDDRLPTGATLSFVTAVKEQKNNYEAIYVYPNPFTNSTNFEFMYNTKATQIIVYNINGELVANENITNQTTYQFHRNNIANGMYFYVVQNKEGEIIGRGKLVLQ